MTTLETTVSMLEMLPEDNLLRIQNFAKCLLMSQKDDTPFKILTKEQILEQLDESANQFNNNEYDDAEAFADKLAEKYDL